MPALIDDTILPTLAVVADPSDLAAALRKRYTGLADRLTLYLPFIPGEHDAFWQHLTKSMQT